MQISGWAIQQVGVLSTVLGADEKTPPPSATEEVKNAGAAMTEAATKMISDPGATSKEWMHKGIDILMDKGPMVLAALAVLIIAWILGRWVRGSLIKALTRAHVDLMLAKFFGNLAKWSIVVFGFVTCLGTLGINTTSIATIVGAAGLAIGLALQGNLSNLASGVLLLIFRPFKIGDSVVVAGQAGIVDGIDLFTTNLDTADNRRLIVPNSSIFGGVIENQTHHPRRCVTILVPVNGGMDMDQTKAVVEAAVQRVAASTKGVLTTPAPSVGLADIAPTVIWGVTVWVETPLMLAVKSALLREVKLAVDEAGVAPPPPVQLVRHVPQ